MSYQASADCLRQLRLKCTPLMPCHTVQLADCGEKRLGGWQDVNVCTREVSEQWCCNDEMGGPVTTIGHLKL